MIIIMIMIIIITIRNINRPLPMAWRFSGPIYCYRRDFGTSSK